MLLNEMSTQDELQDCASIRDVDLIFSIYMKSSDAKASKCHLKFSSLMMIFVKLVYFT